MRPANRRLKPAGTSPAGQWRLAAMNEHPWDPSVPGPRRAPWWILLPCLGLLAAALTPAPGGAQPSPAGDLNWPQWRGPLANGVAPAANPPVTWSETENVRWKV